MMKKSKNLRVPYAAAVYGKPEIDAVVDVLKDRERIAAGPLVREFEKKVSRLFGKKYGVMTNSGSSANLLALETLELAPGSEVITPVLTFSTTLAPILQKGLKPVLADVETGTYVINPKQVESLITKRTKALFIPSLIGNLPDFEKLRKIAQKYKLYFIEDSCDTIGGRFGGRPTGYYSDISTTSFYASHIITAAGGGGMVCFHNPDMARRALVISNWGRQSTLFGAYEKSEEIKKRFAGTIEGQPYDAKFIFSEMGYNFQPTELQGAFGLKQLQSLSHSIKLRKNNFLRLFYFFKNYERYFILPRSHDKASVNWLAFPITIREGAPFSRWEITKYLEERNIQTRPIFTGNVLRQPAFKKHCRQMRFTGSYPQADYVMHGGFLIGAHHGLSSAQIKYLIQSLENFLKKYGS